MVVTTLAGNLANVVMGNPTTGTAIGQARSWKFDIDTDLIENTQGYGSTIAPWKEYILGAYSWTGTIEGNLDTASTVIWTGILANTTLLYATGAIPLALYPNRNTPLRFYYGLVWPKLSVEARLMGVIRFTMDFTGQGPLVQN